MRKIKVLHKVLLFFILILSTSLIHKILLFYNVFNDGIWYKESVGSELFFWASSINRLVLILGLYFIQKSSFIMYNKEYFNSVAIKYLKNGGIIIIIVGLVSIGLEYTSPEINEKTLSIVTTTIVSMFQIIIGASCIIFSEILTKGIELKEDNDLTI